MGTEPWIGYGPWWVADKQGMFKDNDTSVKITSFDADADINAALASGKIDAANVASHTALRFIESGVPVTIVLVLDASETADAIISEPGIKSIADLKGKKVAYEQGTTSDLLLNYALKANGMTIGDIQKVPMGADAAGAALIAGKVPVAVTYEPYITEAKTKDKNIKSLFAASEKEGLISDVLLVRNDFISAHPSVVQNVVNTWGDAVTYYNENKSEARATIAKAVGSNPSDLETAFDGVKIFSLEQNKSLLTGAFAQSTLPAVQQAAIDAKLLDGKVDISKAIDPTFVKAAK